MNLSDEKVLLFDCQTSGASPANAHMIEMGWSVLNNEQNLPAASALVNLPEEYKLPHRIAKMTGISKSELDDADSKEQIWQTICAKESLFSLR